MAKGSGSANRSGVRARGAQARDEASIVNSIRQVSENMGYEQRQSLLNNAQSTFSRLSDAAQNRVVDAVDRARTRYLNSDSSRATERWLFANDLRGRLQTRAEMQRLWSSTANSGANNFNNRVIR